MNDHWEELMWAYVDKKLDPSQEKDLLLELEKNNELNIRFDNVKSLHAQLNEMPIHLPQANLSSQIMNTITNQEIEAEIEATNTKKEIRMIPIILLVFGSLLFTGIILIWIFSGHDNSNGIPLKLDISERSASIIGYAGFLFVCVVLMYRYTMGNQHKSV
jgi:hypothetical protein